MGLGNFTAAVRVRASGAAAVVGVFAAMCALTPGAALAHTSKGDPGSGPGLTGLAPAGHRNHQARVARSAMKLIIAEGDRELRELKTTMAVVRTYDDGIDASCPAALAPVGSAPFKDVSLAALSALTDEMWFDTLAVAERHLSLGMTRFVKRVTTLPWTKANQRSVNGFATRETDLTSAPESDLCADLSTDASDPGSVPAGTETYLRKVLRAKADQYGFGVNVGITTNFYEVLDFGGIPKDDRLFSQMNRVLSRVQDRYQDASSEALSRLETDLADPVKPYGIGGVSLWFTNAT